jgi:F0F1-type ATP synthase membrane subunit a
MAAEQELNATTDIQHHLSFEATSVGDAAFFGTPYVDSLVIGLILGAVATRLIWLVTLRATSGVSNKRQLNTGAWQRN